MTLILRTSHWRAGRLIVASGLQPVGISRGRPHFPVPFDAPTLWSLCPTRAEFSLTDPDAFSEAYTARLRARGAAAILSSIERLPAVREAGGAVLLCWEWPGQPCHRRDLADYLATEGYDAPELLPGEFGEDLVKGRLDLVEHPGLAGDMASDDRDQRGVVGRVGGVEESGEQPGSLSQELSGIADDGEDLQARRAVSASVHKPSVAGLGSDRRVGPPSTFLGDIGPAGRNPAVSARMGAGTRPGARKERAEAHAPGEVR